jgi:hypothetical protein
MTGEESLPALHLVHKMAEGMQVSSAKAGHERPATRLGIDRTQNIIWK